MRKSLFLVLLLSSCSLAPDFKTPDIAIAKDYKNQAVMPEVVENGLWKKALSLEKQDRGEWWKVFADNELNELEKQAIESNQSLRVASANVQRARAEVRANAASFLPDIDIGGNAVRAKSASTSNAAFNQGSFQQLKPYTLYNANVTASYDVDIFNRVRDAEKALNFEADAQEALYRNVLLSLQADVAQRYFQLRALDAERALLKDTVNVRTEAQRIMQKRFKVGSVGEVDVSRTESELAQANADLINLNRQRSILENALALLLGKTASEYHFPEVPLTDSIPPFIPAGIPSELLQRRPDIAVAQAAMQAANERIGVARAAFFPNITLTANGGLQSTSLSDIFKWSSRSWALGQVGGSALVMNLFDSGRNFGALDAAHATYEASVALYREQVLSAMGDVENALTDQRLMAELSREQEVAAAASKRTTELTQKRYDQGDATYFEVVDAQRNMLAATRAAIQTRGNRQLATIALIQALGGGWPEQPEQAAVVQPEVKAPEQPAPAAEAAPAPVAEKAEATPIKLVEPKP